MNLIMQPESIEFSHQAKNDPLMGMRYGRLIYLVIGESILLAIVIALSWLTTLDTVLITYSVGFIGFLLTTLSSYFNLKQARTMDSGIRQDWSPIVFLVYSSPIINFIVWGILLYASAAPQLLSSNLIHPTERSATPKLIAKPPMRVMASPSTSKDKGVTFRYEGVSFRVGIPIADALLPLKTHKDLRIVMERHGGSWEVGRKGVNVPDFWIHVKDDHIWSVWVNSSKVTLEGLHNIQVGDSEQNIILRWGSAADIRQGSTRLPPGHRKGSSLWGRFSASKPGDGGFWSSYPVGPDEMQIHYSNGIQTVNQLVVFQT